MDDLDSRLRNCQNPHQNIIRYPRTLCLCSAGMLRSPTIAWVIGQPPYNRNARAAGLIERYALIPVDQVLTEWADEIVVADEGHRALCTAHPYLIDENGRLKKTVYCLDIPDEFPYRDSRLVELIKRQLEAKNFPKYDLPTRSASCKLEE